MVEGKQSKHNDDWPPVREQFNYYKEIISKLQSIEESRDKTTIRKVTNIWRCEYQKHVGIGRRIFMVGNGGS